MPVTAACSAKFSFGNRPGLHRGIRFVGKVRAMRYAICLLAASIAGSAHADPQLTTQLTTNSTQYARVVTTNAVRYYKVIRTVAAPVDS